MSHTSIVRFLGDHRTFAVCLILITLAWSIPAQSVPPPNWCPDSLPPGWQGPLPFNGCWSAAPFPVWFYYLWCFIFRSC